MSDQDAKTKAHGAEPLSTAGLGGGLIVPEGWQLVPTIPTAEMLKTFAMETPESVFADRDAVHRVYGWAAIDKIYRAMIAVAPKPPNV